MDYSEQISRLQILVFGVSGVGKTTLIQQLSEINAHVFRQEVKQDADEIEEKNTASEKLIFQEVINFQFPSFKKLAIQRSDAFILMYDVEDVMSFNYVCKFFTEIKHVKGQNAPVFVVGNRTSITEECNTHNEMDDCDYDVSLDCTHLQVCAQSGDGMKDLFSCMLGRLCQYFVFPTENINITQKTKQPFSKRLSDYFRKKLQRLNSN